MAHLIDLIGAPSPASELNSLLADDNRRPHHQNQIYSALGATSSLDMANFKSISASPANY
jgi:hypothetical protein